MSRTLKLIKLDLLGLGMLAAIDEPRPLIEHDCAVCVDLDWLPEDIPEVFQMLQAADTVGVFQVESRAQMQTLPKSRPMNLDDLVVEVAIIRPGPIQGNAVHPYLRRNQGLEPVELPPPEPRAGPPGHDRRDPLPGAGHEDRDRGRGFLAGESRRFPAGDGHVALEPRDGEAPRPLRRGRCASRGFPRRTPRSSSGRSPRSPRSASPSRHAAAFARTAYESSFLKLFYPAQFLVGLINAQPMGFYPVEVLVNDAKRHGVAVLPVDVNRSRATNCDRVGRAAGLGDGGRVDEPLPDGAGIERRPVRPSPACVVPVTRAASTGRPTSAAGWGIRLGLRLVKGIGEEDEQLLDAEMARGPYLARGRRRADGPGRRGDRAADPCRRARFARAATARAALAAPRGRRARSRGGSVCPGAGRRPADRPAAATDDAPPLPGLTESERLGDAYAIVGSTRAAR